MNNKIPDEKTEEQFRHYVKQTKTLIAELMLTAPLTPSEKAAVLQEMMQTMITPLIILASGDRGFMRDRLQDSFVLAYAEYERIISEVKGCEE